MWGTTRALQVCVHTRQVLILRARAAHIYLFTFYLCWVEWTFSSGLFIAVHFKTRVPITHQYQEQVMMLRLNSWFIKDTCFLHKKEIILEHNDLQLQSELDIHWALQQSLCKCVCFTSLLFVTNCHKSKYFMFYKLDGLCMNKDVNIHLFAKMSSTDKESTWPFLIAWLQ